MGGELIQLMFGFDDQRYKTNLEGRLGVCVRVGGGLTGQDAQVADTLDEKV